MQAQKKTEVSEDKQRQSDTGAMTGKMEDKREDFNQGEKRKCNIEEEEGKRER